MLVIPDVGEAVLQAWRMSASEMVTLLASKAWRYGQSYEAIQPVSAESSLMPEMPLCLSRSGRMAR